MKKYALHYAMMHRLMLFAFHRFFRRIEVLGVENIPEDEPAIFTMNHPNAVLDPILTAMFHQRQPGFLTRSDVFKNPLLARIFRSFKMLPVYRQRDGVNTIEANGPVFKAVTEFLNAGGAIVIAPEGDKGIDHHLLPLKKGTARIAIQFMLECNWEKPLFLCPVGLCYGQYFKHKSELVVRYGPPICINDYREAYDRDPQGIFQLITNDLANAIKPLMWHVEEESDLPIFYRLKALDGVRPLLSQRMDWAMEELESIKKQKEEKKRKFIEMADSYIEKLKNRSISDHHVAAATGPNKTAAFFFSVITAPLLIPDWLLNGLPRYIPYAVVRAMNVHPHFHTSLLFGFMFLLFPVYYIFLAAVVWIFSESPAAAAGIPVAGLLFSNFRNWWENQYKISRANAPLRENRDKLKRLIDNV